MKAKINHLTIVSESNHTLGRFYEGFFHLRPAGDKGALQSANLGDGHIGLTIKPRLSGDRAQLDHFGIEVDDLDVAIARIREHYPAIAFSDGSAGGPVSTYDPAGNVFALYQTGRNNGGEFYRADGGARDRVIDHVALRVMHPAKVAEFYTKVFGFTRVDRPNPGRNLYLSDGNVTLALILWTLSDFENTGISARGLDHIGFKVESLAAFKADVDLAKAQNFRVQPNASLVGRGKEGAARLAMLQKTCPLGCHHLADTDGLIVDVRE